MKAQRPIHATKGQEQAVKCTDKPSGHNMRISSRQATDTHGSGAHIRLKHHQLVPSQYRNGGSWVRGKRKYGSTMKRRGEPILGFPLKLFWGKYPTGMTYHPK